MGLVDKNYKKKIFNLKKSCSKKKNLKLFKANFFIDYNLLNKNVFVYNGTDFVSIVIKKEMLGFRFGDFIVTRKNFKFPKKKGKK